LGTPDYVPLDCDAWLRHIQGNLLQVTSCNGRKYLKGGGKLGSLEAEDERDIESPPRAGGSVAIGEPGEEVGGLGRLLFLRVWGEFIPTYYQTPVGYH
jgi:hypothetical protein